MPETTKEVIFRFFCDKLPDSTFSLVRLDGREALSSLFQFRLDLVAESAEVDPSEIVNHPARIEFEREGDISYYHGIVPLFEQRDRGPEFVNYHALLVPRLYLLTLTRQSMVFLDQTVPEIVEQVLKNNQFKDEEDYKFKVTRPGPKREYVVQYEETDLDFVQRLLEAEGICYFFEHTEKGHRVIITDKKSMHTPVSGESVIPYREARSVNVAGEAVGALTFRQQVLPQEVLLKDYNYRTPSVAVQATATAVANGFGKIREYGDHFKTPEEGKDLAEIRAEEIRCREKVYFGESGCRHFRSGHTFTLEDHFRAANNIKYLLVEVTHHGRQLGVVGTASGGAPDEPAYLNQFEAIPYDVQFRPARVTPKPRISGVMHARVDSGGQYAEIDADGRYKIKVPFDLSDKTNGSASRFMRMAQPYSGPGYGHHFPLHKGVEVLLTHQDGDPDRPIVAGSVPNPETKSPVTGPNLTQSIMRTAAGNEFIIEDQAGSERIMLHSPFDNSYLYIGSPNSTSGIRATTDGHGVIHAKRGIYFNAWPTSYWETGNASRILNGAIAAAGSIGAAAAAAGGGGLAFLGAVASAAGAVANVAAPGIVLASPAGISAMTPSTFTAAGLAGVGLLTPAMANVVGVSAAALMSGGGVHIYTIAGGIRIVASFGDIKINARAADIVGIAKKNILLTAQTKDIKGTAKESIILDAETKNVHIGAKNHIEAVSAEGEINLHAQKLDIGLKAKQNIELAAEDENVSIKGKKRVVLIAESEDVQIAANSTNVGLKAAKEIILECGASKITLRENGQINISGKNIIIEGENASMRLDDKGFEIEGDKGKISAGEIKAEATSGGNFTIKGGMVEIN